MYIESGNAEIGAVYGDHDHFLFLGFHNMNKIQAVLVKYMNAVNINL